jgi:hypothetical protein
MINFTLSKHNRDILKQRIDNLDEDKIYTVEIRERKIKRSIDQNKRLWKLYTVIGDSLGYQPEEMHELLAFKFLGEEKNINGEKIFKVPSTSTLTIDDMAEYQRQIEFWASTNFGMQFRDGL